MRVLKQSTARDVMVFMTDEADHVSGKTGLTLTITASKAGAAFGSISPTVTERGNGWYSLALTTSHTDTLGDLALHVTSSGADPSDVLMQVVAYDMGDAVRLGLTALPNAVPGASGGLFIAGTNASCTITGNLLVQGGITVTQSSSNQPAIIATGNGTGQGARFVGGNGAAGVDIAGTGSAPGLTIGAGTGAGIGLSIMGGGTSGVGISVLTTSGDGISITPTAGHGVLVTANGSSKHGLQVTGGTSGTSDGVKFVAGSGGVSFNATLSTVTNLTNAPTSGDLTATMKASLADAVWDEAMSGHVTAGTFGEGASDWASQTDLADGVKVVSTGLDLVLVDGVALPKALQRIGAVTAGKLPSGAGTSTEAFVGLDGSTTRVTFTVDVDGNRTAVTYNDA